MGNALIIFTPRSGSTIAAELLAHKHRAINLDEFMTGDIRPAIRNKLPVKFIEAVDNFRSINPKLSDKKEVNMNQMQKLVYAFEVYQERFKFITQLNQYNNIVLKYYPSFGSPGVKLTQWAIDNNFELYFVKRRCIEEQLYSCLLADSKENFYKAAKAAGRLQIPTGAGFINTKSTPRVVFPPVELTDEVILARICDIQAINSSFESYYTKFKDYGTLAVYEDTIVKEDFSQFNISSDVVAEYRSKPGTLTPTHEYVVGSQITNWDHALDLLRYYGTTCNE